MKILYCWGANSHGQQGCGDLEDCSSPRRVALPSGFIPIDITGGGAHTLLFGTDSESTPMLLTCGSNSHGQLGHSPTESRVPTWRQVALPSTTSDLFVRKLSAGWDFSAVLLENGKLLMWGSNHYGQLAQDLTTTMCWEAVHIEGLYSDAACGMRHTVLLDTGGVVYTCGAGRAGQLGTGSTGAKSPVLTRVEFDPALRPMRVAAGAYHSAAVTLTSQVHVWGSNKHGQCRQNPQFAMKSANAPVLRFDLYAESEWNKNLMASSSLDDSGANRELHHASALVSGWTHLVLVVDNGTMFTWGRSDYGQLGRKPNECESDLPGSVGLTVKQAACGSEHVLALSLDSKVFSWGWNEHGMCGTGNETDVHKPTIVKLPYKAVKVGAGAGHSFAICDDENDDLCLRTDVKHAQMLRDRLESLGLFDKRRRIEKVGDSVAIPVTGVPEKRKYDSISYRVVNRALAKSKTASHKNWREKLLASLDGNFEETDIPKHFERYGDLVLFHEDAFRGRKWEERFRYLPELWVLVKQSLGCGRLARKSSIKNDDFRSPQVEVLAGNDGKVEHVDNGIKYTWDIQFCMFSSGNITEKLRVSELVCRGETVVDLYAGIGYFTLPYLVHADAARVHACEWNPHSVRFLKENLKLNGVSDKCEVYEGDNRLVAPRGVADRVNLGLIPTSSPGWLPACLALKRPLGGVLHVHQNVTSSVAMDTADSVAKETSEVAVDTSTDSVAMATTMERFPSEKDFSKMNITEFSYFICEQLRMIFQENYDEIWNVRVVHVETVKSYAPRIDHCVFDVDCRPPNVD